MIKKSQPSMIKKSSIAKKSPAKHAAMAKPTIAASEGDWQGRDDMHTLKNAEQIKADPKRHHAAVHHAKAEVCALQKVARKKV